MIGALFLMSSSLVLVSMLSINVQPNLLLWNDHYFSSIATLLAGPVMGAIVSAAASVALFANLLAQHLCAGQALCFASEQGWVPAFFSTTYGESETARWSVVGTGCAVALLQFVPRLLGSDSGSSFSFISKIWFLLYSIVILGLLLTFLKLRVSKPPNTTSSVRPLLTSATLTEQVPILLGPGSSIDAYGAAEGLGFSSSNSLRRPFVALGSSIFSGVILCIPPLLIVATNFWFFLQGRGSTR